MTERHKLEQRLKELREDAAEFLRRGDWYGDMHARFATHQADRIELQLKEQRP